MQLLEGLGTRLEELVKVRFNGNVSAFLRKCAEIDEEATPDNATVKKYYQGSIPGLEKAAVMAKALGVSLGELAGIEKPRSTEEQTGANVREDRTPYDVRGRLIDPGRIEPEETSKTMVGYFDFGDRVIKASLLLESYGPPGRFGGYSPDEPGADE